ncbi:MAG: spore coat associated protein CotJA [Lachnospiraceae bacterium]|nr:spore coat associated protein CotJA [Lachnospiraceae bacterium]
MDRPISLAMAYVKWQQFDKIYEDLEKGYKAGTIFPELNLPFTGRRCEK